MSEKRCGDVAKLRLYNPNPFGIKVGDCVIRAISAATNQTWDEAYTGVSFQGFALKDMPSSNHVWGEYLKSQNFERRAIPNTCPDCYTVNDFAEEHPHGVYVLGTGLHAVAVINGEIWDSWDSRNEVPVYYYREVR